MANGIEKNGMYFMYFIYRPKKVPVVVLIDMFGLS